VAEKLLVGQDFKKSQNDYDWLGWGIYFWEANPKRGLDFAKRAMKRAGSKIKAPTVIGAIIDLGNCLDLMSAMAIDMVRAAYESLSETFAATGGNLRQNRDPLLHCREVCAGSVAATIFGGGWGGKASFMRSRSSRTSGSGSV
jgi:hypothetical protein